MGWLQLTGERGEAAKVDEEDADVVFPPGSELFGPPALHQLGRHGTRDVAREQRRCAASRSGHVDDPPDQGDDSCGKHTEPRQQKVEGFALAQAGPFQKPQSDQCQPDRHRRDPEGRHQHDQGDDHTKDESQDDAIPGGWGSTKVASERLVQFVNCCMASAVSPSPSSTTASGLPR